MPAPPLLQRPTALPLALLLYVLMALCVRCFGVVGEVDAGWARGAPPWVAVDLEGGQPTWSGPGRPPHAGHAFGPLLASQTRPLERLQVGGVWLPLAINSYTGGPPDWPARLLHGVTGSQRAVRGLHLLLGAGLLVALAALLRAVGLREAPGVALLVLATDWCFVFYRHALGGTELALLGAGLLLLWALWRRRWWGLGSERLLGLALGLGLLAKATFLPSALAFLLASLLTRWDRPRGVARPGLGIGPVLVLVLACTAPLWIGLLHGLALPDVPRVVSHDGLGLQLARLGHGLRGLIGGNGGPAREMPASLAYLLLDPLRWFAPALGAPAVGWGWAAARSLGWALVALGVAFAWAGRPWRRDPTPQGALLRWLSVAAPLQLGLLWLANRDLHHLAQATPTLALLAGLAVERIARRGARSAAGRGALAMLLCLPLLVTGFASAVRTPALVRAIPAPAITEGGQEALVALLRAHGVERLWTSDYDLYGVFEVREPSIELRHAWGAVSASRDRQALLVDLLRAARGEHYLVVKPAAARIYDLAPTDARVQQAAASAGVQATLVGALEGEGWARLYAISSPRQSPASGVISPP